MSSKPSTSGDAAIAAAGLAIAAPQPVLPSVPLTSTLIALAVPFVGWIQDLAARTPHYPAMRRCDLAPACPLRARSDESWRRFTVTRGQPSQGGTG